MPPDDPASLSGEDRLIETHFASLPLHPGAFGLRDDAAAFVPPAGCDLVVTKDALVAGVHFFADDPPDAIAMKALRVNLSDLAAKGADPFGFLLALALPEQTSEDWLTAFSRGLGEDARTFSCSLLGGDTVRSPGPLMLSITALGTTPKGTIVRREGARAGDLIFVSGTIGDAALGLRVRRDADSAGALRLAKEQENFLLHRYLLPQPRNALSADVRTNANAAMDISDGLVGDLSKLCRVSGVSAKVDVARVPLSLAARAAIAADGRLLPVALTGGDDYEILCTVSAAHAESFMRAAEQAEVPVSQIGAVVEGHQVPQFFAADGSQMKFEHASFSHF